MKTFSDHLPYYVKVMIKNRHYFQSSFLKHFVHMKAQMSNSQLKIYVNLSNRIQNVHSKKKKKIPGYYFITMEGSVEIPYLAKVNPYHLKMEDFLFMNKLVLTSVRTYGIQVWSWQKNPQLKQLNDLKRSIVILKRVEKPKNPKNRKLEITRIQWCWESNTQCSTVRSHLNVTDNGNKHEFVDRYNLVGTYIYLNLLVRMYPYLQFAIIFSQCTTLPTLCTLYIANPLLLSLVDDFTITGWTVQDLEYTCTNPTCPTKTFLLCLHINFQKLCCSRQEGVALSRFNSPMKPN